MRTDHGYEVKQQNKEEGHPEGSLESHKAILLIPSKLFIFVGGRTRYFNFELSKMKTSSNVVIEKTFNVQLFINMQA